MQHRKHQWVSVIALAGVIIAWAGLWPAQDSLGQADDRGDATANRVEGVANFRLDPESGPMAIYALHSCFDVLGFNFSYSRLAGISGQAFKFVYDTTGTYEPLRGLFPTDVLQSAAEQMGFDKARWETGGSIDEVMATIKREIDAGRPLIAPNLETSAYQGLFVITGYDLETRHILIQGAFRKTGYDSVPVAEGWDGPTAGPAGWASNPLFVLRRQAKGSGEARAGKNGPSIAAAIDIMKGGYLEYGRHPGEEPHLGEAGPHKAAYGLRAFELLSQDIAYRPLVTIEDGEQHLDFDFLGRIDSQVGQLQHDRTHAFTFMWQIGTSLPPERVALLEEINDTFRAISKDAKALRELFWQVMPADVATADSAVAYAGKSPSLALMVASGPEVVDALRSMGEPVFETTWGWVMIADSPEKRMNARLLVRAIVSRERNCIRMLEELLPDVDTRLEMERPEGQKRPFEDQ